MTLLRRDPANISNHFDDLFKGLGLRNSSFMDIDSVHHDGMSGRFLFIEFKNWNADSGYVEEVNTGQSWVLSSLARLPRCSAWIIWKPSRADGQYRLRVLPLASIICLDREQLRHYYASWWGRQLSLAVPSESEREHDPTC